MYKFERYRQIGLSDFNQPFGLKMDPENRWVKKAETIPWDAVEERYAKLFPSKIGMPAKSLRTALGALLIQKQLGFSDRELVEEITENPYLQYFIGLPGYQAVPSFVPPLLVEFRKRLTADVLCEIKEMIIEYNTPDDPTPGGGNPTEADAEGGNTRTLILDVTCAPQKITFPQDISILNEVRENLEAIIDDVCDRFYYYKPRMYRNNEKKDYLNLAKCKKRTAKKIRAAIKKQLQYIWRDRKYLKSLLGCAFRTGRDLQYQPAIYLPNRKRESSSAGRIWGKAGSQGHYPERVLTDKIYWNRANLGFCKEQVWYGTDYK